MRFFTPELYRAIQHDWEVADAEWHHRADVWRAELAALRPTLPRGLFDLVETGLLHDAEVVAARLEPDVLEIQIVPDDPEFETHLGPGTVLRYQGVRGASVECAGTLEEASRAPLEIADLVGADWLYDELRAVDGAFEHHALLWLPGCPLAVLGVRFDGFERVPVR